MLTGEFHWWCLLDIRTCSMTCQGCYSYDVIAFVLAPPPLGSNIDSHRHRQQHRVSVRGYNIFQFFPKWDSKYIINVYNLKADHVHLCPMALSMQLRLPLPLQSKGNIYCPVITLSNNLTIAKYWVTIDSVHLHPQSIWHQVGIQLGN